MIPPYHRLNNAGRKEGKPQGLSHDLWMPLHSFGEIFDRLISSIDQRFAPSMRPCKSVQ
jgi:hypothetical protein